MAKYLVTMVPGQHVVSIWLDGFGPAPSAGEEELGSFEFKATEVDNQVNDPDDINRNGDHPFIVEARKLMRDQGATEAHLKQFTFLDKASNATQVDYDENPGLATDDLATLDADMDDSTDGPGGHSEASTQAGGVQSSVTGEHRPGTQEAGDTAGAPPATQAAQKTKAPKDPGKGEPDKNPE